MRQSLLVRHLVLAREIDKNRRLQQDKLLIVFTTNLHVLMLFAEDMPFLLLP